MPATYRIATAADRPNWITLRGELWPRCPEQRHALEVQQLLAGDGVVVFAESDAELVGFIEISLRRDHVEGTSQAPVPYVEGWYVRPAHRGEGLGQGLMAYVDRWALERGFTEVASDTELHNSVSIALHQALGFREVGRSVHFVKRLSPNVANPEPPLAPRQRLG